MYRGVRGSTGLGNIPKKTFFYCFPKRKAWLSLIVWHGNPPWKSSSNVAYIPQQSSNVVKCERTGLWRTHWGRHSPSSYGCLVVHIFWGEIHRSDSFFRFDINSPNSSPNWESMSMPAGPPSSIRNAVVRAPFARSSIPDCKSCIGLAANRFGWFRNWFPCAWFVKRFPVCWKPIWGLPDASRSDELAQRKIRRLRMQEEDEACLNNILPCCDWVKVGQGQQSLLLLSNCETDNHKETVQGDSITSCVIPSNWELI